MHESRDREVEERRSREQASPVLSQEGAVAAHSSTAGDIHTCVPFPCTITDLNTCISTWQLLYTMSPCQSSSNGHLVLRPLMFVFRVNTVCTEADTEPAGVYTTNGRRLQPALLEHPLAARACWQFRCGEHKTGVTSVVERQQTLKAGVQLV
ncbi:hypothetical protein COO60DRAFT_1631374 [Scenedesmus sp. NREL 46B-D3]|nr:hypothetical protein COO60DRAFT_1631374 [Scenedesmus sp. NREL 46B-D3]